MKYLILFTLFAIFFTTSCSSDSPETIAKTQKEKSIDEQNAEYATKSKEWLNQKQILDKQNSKVNDMEITATRPVFNEDKEKIKIVQQKAAEGDADYQYSLGMCYKYGYGMPKDTDQALFWFKKAADQGHKKAAQVYNFMVNRK